VPISELVEYLSWFLFPASHRNSTFMALCMRSRRTAVGNRTQRRNISTSRVVRAELERFEIWPHQSPALYYLSITALSSFVLSFLFLRSVRILPAHLLPEFPSPLVKQGPCPTRWRWRRPPMGLQWSLTMCMPPSLRFHCSSTLALDSKTPRILVLPTLWADTLGRFANKKPINKQIKQIKQINQINQINQSNPIQSNPIQSINA